MSWSKNLESGDNPEESNNRSVAAFESDYSNFKEKNGIGFIAGALSLSTMAREPPNFKEVPAQQTNPQDYEHITSNLIGTGNSKNNEMLIGNLDKKNILILCSVCDYRPYHHKDLVNHLVEIHTSTRFNFEFCNHKTSLVSDHHKNRKDYHRDKLSASLVDPNGNNLMKKNVSKEGKHFICNVCTYKSNNKDNLISHLVENHSRVMYKCEFCLFNTDTLPSLAKHRVEEHPNNTDSVTINLDSNSDGENIKLDNNNSLSTRHSDEIGIENKAHVYKCNHCKYKTTLKLALIRHVYDVHRKMWVIESNKSNVARPVNQMNLYCHFCDFKTDDKNELYKHKEEIHKDGKVFLCTHCKFKSSEITDLNKHMLTCHTNYTTYSCPDCTYKAYSETDFNEHLLKCCTTENKLYTCAKCNFTSKTESYLQQHAALHASSRFFCDSCQYLAANETDLNIHILTVHVNVELYACKFCEFKTNEAADFYKHALRYHTGNNCYTSRICDYVGNKERDLDYHRIYCHNNMPQFSCAKCNYKTKVKAELTRHLQTNHTYVEPSSSKSDKLSKIIMGHIYICSICSFKTIGEKELTNHMKQLHRGNISDLVNDNNFIIYKMNGDDQSNLSFRIYSCCFCDFKTDQKNDLIKHHQRSHSDANNTLSVIHSSQNTYDNNEVIRIDDVDDDAEFAESINIMSDKHTNHDARLNSLPLNSDIRDENPCCEVLRVETDIVNELKKNVNQVKLNYENGFDSDLKLVPKTNKNAKIYSCRACDFKANCERDLYPHALKSHINPAKSSKTNLYSCSICDFKSDQEGDLTSHTLRHHILVRNIVGDIIVQEGGTDEIITVDDDDDKVHDCKFCHFRTTDNNDLKNHYWKLHENQRSKVNRMKDFQDSGQIITIDDDDDNDNSPCKDSDTNSSLKNISIDESNHCKANEISSSTAISYPTGKSELINELEKLERKVEEKTYSCKTSKYKSNKEDLKHHLTKFDHNSKGRLLHTNPYWCGLCEFKTNKGRTLNTHVKTLHSLELTSNGCKSYAINNKNSIKILNKLSNALNRCTVCNFASDQTRDLNIHIISVHWKEKVRTCNNCEYVCINETDLVQHIKFCHKNTVKYTCSICEYKSKSEKEFRRHQLDCHKNETNYFCSYCRFKTAQISKLILHINRSHKDDKNYSCRYCCYKTKWMKDLHVHLKLTHSYVKRFCCGYCIHFRTNHLSNLTLHIRVAHKGNKQFICDFCNLNMRSKISLQKHIFTKHKELFEESTSDCQ